MVVTNKNGETNSDFIIKDNILIGKHEPLTTEYKGIGKLLLDRMKEKPESIGQFDIITGATYTFAEMYDLTVKCALWLRQQGIQKNDVVALCSPNIMDSFAPFFATFCVGAIFTPWNPAMDIREARYFMKLSGAKIVFADESSVNTIKQAADSDKNDITIVVFGENLKAIPFSKIVDGHKKFDIDNFHCTTIDDNHDTAMILYSSGTTGPSKGVQLSHFVFLYHLLNPGGLTTDGLPLWLSSYFWISGVLLTLNCLVNHCKRFLYPTFEEEMTCKIIEKYKISWLFLSPSMINRILNSGYFKKYDMSSVTNIFLGGAKFSENSQNKLKECLPNANTVQMYGMTELGGILTAQHPHHKAGTVGTVLKNCQIKIIDLETGVALGPNKSGELLAKSITITNGYYNNPKATKETIDEDGWLHTGDLAYYDDDGEIVIIDRLKETIKYRGVQISPCEIENLLETYKDVVEVAVIGVPHLQDDEHPLAFVTTVPGSKVTERDLQDFVEKNMTDIYYLRDGVKFLDKMPHTPSGKISRKDLKAMVKGY
ncbi:PREDICTED: 4-coumarate--CoA ligase 1-like [Polistes dominula]|uniref:4-coumarate--CoA ligase 1-like n=1 Tax=Polistes dominula TaxID=743375 RepID=A0ABM1HZF7_POLDO|nr:PREDICTED: 4-coumarate--CoA ligase 1-like [Polistes dominula]